MASSGACVSVGVIVLSFVLVFGLFFTVSFLPKYSHGQEMRATALRYVRQNCHDPRIVQEIGAHEDCDRRMHLIERWVSLHAASDVFSEWFGVHFGTGPTGLIMFGLVMTMGVVLVQLMMALAAFLSARTRPILPKFDSARFELHKP